MVFSLAAHLLDRNPYWGSTIFKECHNDHGGIWGAPTSVCNDKYPVSVILRAGRNKEVFIWRFPQTVPFLPISVSCLTGFTQLKATV